MIQHMHTHRYKSSTEGSCRCTERDTLSEATVTLRTVVTFVTWLISRTEFLVPNPILSIRESVVLCMGESEIPYLRLQSH